MAANHITFRCTIHPFFVNGINSDVFIVDEDLHTGISLEELNGRTFQQIVENKMAKY